MLGRVGLVSNDHLFGSFEGGMANDVLHAVFLQVPPVDIIQTLDVVITALLDSTARKDTAEAQSYV